MGGLWHCYTHIIPGMPEASCLGSCLRCLCWEGLQISWDGRSKSPKLGYGGVHSYGGTPIAGWFIMETPTRMNDLDMFSLFIAVCLEISN